MASHKFKIGEIVTSRPSLRRNVPGGVYEVISSFRTTAVSSNIASRA